MEEALTFFDLLDSTKFAALEKRFPIDLLATLLNNYQFFSQG